MPYSCILYGIPYEMRREVGQEPRHLIQAGRTEGWVYLNESDPKVKAFLDEQRAKANGLPGYPYEWQEVES
jgi:hypothetical protein